MMTIKQREANHLYHLAGLTVYQVAEKLNISQEEVANLLMSWEKFYKKATNQ